MPMGRGHLGAEGVAEPGHLIAKGAMRWVLMFAIAASVVACIHGVRAAGLFAQTYWADPRVSAITSALTLLAMVGLIPVARWLSISYAFLATAAFALVAAAFAGIGPVAAVLLHMASAFCIGSLFFRGAVERDGGAWIVLATIFGTAVLSLAVCVMSFFPVNNPATYLALLLAPLVLGGRRGWGALGDSLRYWRDASIRDAGPWPGLLAAISAGALMLQLFSVLRPELGADALATHLVVADQLQTHGRFHYDVGESIWAVMPLGSDWAFALTNMISGSEGARLGNFAAELLICASIFMAGRRVAAEIAGLVAVMLYVTMPLAYLETTSLFTENFWVIWILGALGAGAWTLWNDRPRLTAASGFLLGAALSAKVITVFMAPFFLALAVAWCFVAPKRPIRNLLIFAASCVAGGALPYANAWIRTGNPVFPFMNEIFRSPLFDTAASFDNPLFKSPLDWLSLYDTTFRTSNYLESYPGGLGLALMLFLPAAALLALTRSWAWRISALCVVAFVAGVFHFQSYLRYILPALPIAAIGMGAVVAEISTPGKAWRAVALSLAVVVALAGLALTPTANHFYRSNSLPPFWGSDEQKDYVDRVRPEQSLARVIAALNLDRVLWLGSPYIAGTGSDVFVVNWHGGKQLVDRYQGLADEAGFRKLIADWDFNAIAVVPGFDGCKHANVCDFLEKHTQKVYSVGGASLYVPGDDILFVKELLANPGFDNGHEGWSGEGTYEAGADDAAVVVTAAKPFVQAVPVTGGHRYLLEVRGRCTPDHADYRAQVNWQDAGGRFITTNIDVVACEPEYSTHTTTVTAPPDAASAIVYASSHDPERSAEITEVSFRE